MKDSWNNILQLIWHSDTFCNGQHCSPVFLEDEDPRIEDSSNKETAPIWCNMCVFDVAQLQWLGICKGSYELMPVTSNIWKQSLDIDGQTAESPTRLSTWYSTPFYYQQVWCNYSGLCLVMYNGCLKKYLHKNLWNLL